LNNLGIVRDPLKASRVEYDGPINIGKRQKPIPRVNPAQTPSLHFIKIHWLKSGLIKPLGPKNSIVKFGFKT